MLVSNYLKHPPAPLREWRAGNYVKNHVLRFTYLRFIDDSILKYHYRIINNQKTDE